MAPLVASALHVPWEDLDNRTARLLGYRAAGEALQAIGLGAFRQAEFEALSHAIEVRGARVIALGGGTPTAPGAEELLNDAASAQQVWIIYLRASAALLQDRLRAGGASSRPSLTGASPIEELPAVLALRDPMYARLASSIIDVDGVTPESLLQSILESLPDPLRESLSP